MNQFQNSPSTDEHAPLISAPGKSHSETTSPSTGEAAPGVSFYSVLQSQKSVVALLFMIFTVLLAVIYLIWTGKLDRWISTWSAMFPTLAILIAVLGTVLGFFIRRLADDVAVESNGGPEADATQSEPQVGKVVKVVRVPGDYSACECIQTQSGLVVVIHTNEGYVRLDAEALLQSPVLWSVDKPRMARWIDGSQNLLNTTSVNA